ncbi:MAG: TA system VapC family ribonuclease toxin [Acidimicrobiales bacterium]
MSQTIDTNILVYATHTASPHHDRARALVEHLVAGPAIAYVLWPAILGYLRIVTHPAILESPLATDEAMANIENLIAPTHIRTAGEGDDFWPSFRRVTADVKPRGKLVPDSHLVALMLELGLSTVWTRDRDFRKFSGITIKDPFDDRYSAGFQ